jgi:hypothetical protein
MVPTWVEEGLGHEGIKNFGEFFSKIAKKLPNYTRIEKKERKRERPKFPLPFFWGQKMTIF